VHLRVPDFRYTRIERIHAQTRFDKRAHLAKKFLQTLTEPVPVKGNPMQKHGDKPETRPQRKPWARPQIQDIKSAQTAGYSQPAKSDVQVWCWYTTPS
jgi:hypothetical protein